MGKVKGKLKVQVCLHRKINIDRLTLELNGKSWAVTMLSIPLKWLLRQLSRGRGNHWHGRSCSWPLESSQWSTIWISLFSLYFALLWEEPGWAALTLLTMSASWMLLFGRTENCWSFSFVWPAAGLHSWISCVRGYPDCSSPWIETSSDQLMSWYSLYLAWLVFACCV